MCSKIFAVVERSRNEQCREQSSVCSREYSVISMSTGSDRLVSASQVSGIYPKSYLFSPFGSSAIALFTLPYAALCALPYLY